MSLKILGIHDVICSGLAVFEDNKTTYAVHEERFSRRKNDDHFPAECIKSLSNKEFDYVAFPSNFWDLDSIIVHKGCNFSIDDYVKEQKDYWKLKIFDNKDPKYTDVYNEKVDLDQFDGKVQLDKLDDVDTYELRKYILKKHIDIPDEKIVFHDHHSCHAAYAYYGSPLRGDDVLIVTIDAHGDGCNATLSRQTANGIERIFQTDQFNLARYYRYITLVMGMKPNEHEYKVMGMAPYAKEPIWKKPYNILKETMYVDGLDFKYKEKPGDSYYYFKDKFEGCRFDGIAGGLQKWTEDILCDWITNAVKHTGAKRVVVSGGVAMNIKAMGKVTELPGVEDLYVCGSGSDESLCIGATYLQAEKVFLEQGKNPDAQIKPLETLCIGPTIKTEDIETAVENWSNRDNYEVMSYPGHNKVAEILAQGVILARCCGPMEFGQRALGNRSILADPRNGDIVPKINEQIKSRDFWMPFAPIVLDSDVEDLLVNPKKIRSPFMTIGFETTERASTCLRAALHPSDKTARPQILEEKVNPDLYALINEFKKVTGVGAVLNTSFNLHGFPIVKTPEDAFHVLDNSSLDGLIFENYLIMRKDRE